MRVVGTLNGDALAAVAGAERLATLEEVLARCRLSGWELVDVVVLSA